MFSAAVIGRTRGQTELRDRLQTVTPLKSMHQDACTTTGVASPESTVESHNDMGENKQSRECNGRDETPAGHVPVPEKKQRCDHDISYGTCGVPAVCSAMHAEYDQGGLSGQSPPNPNLRNLPAMPAVISTQSSRDIDDTAEVAMDITAVPSNLHCDSEDLSLQPTAGNTKMSDRENRVASENEGMQVVESHCNYELHHGEQGPADSVDMSANVPSTPKLVTVECSQEEGERGNQHLDAAKDALVNRRPSETGPDARPAIVQVFSLNR